MSRKDKPRMIIGKRKEPPRENTVIKPKQQHTTNISKSFIQITNNRLQFKLKQLQTLKESLTSLLNKFFDCFDEQVNKTIDSTSSRIKVRKRIGNAQTIDRSYKEIKMLVDSSDKKLSLLEKDNGINQENIAKEISEYVNELKENEYVKKSSEIVYEKFETLLKDLIQIIDELREEVILKRSKDVNIGELSKYFRETQKKLSDIFKQEGIVHIKQPPTINHQESNLDILPQIFIHIPCDVELDKELFGCLKKQLVDIIGKDFVLADIEKGSVSVKIMLLGTMAKEVMKNVICGNKKLPESVENVLKALENYEFSIVTSTKRIVNVKPDLINVKQPSKHKILKNLEENGNKKKDGSLKNVSEELKEFLERKTELKDINLMELANQISDDDILMCIELVKDEAIKQEISTQMLIVEGIKEQMGVFEQKLEEVQRNSIFEFKVNKIAFIDKEKREKYKETKSKCPNVQSKVVFHGSNIDACSSIVCGDFRMSKAAKYGLGIYFTDSLDYSRYYSGEKSNRENLRKIPHVGDCHTFVQTEIYYDSSKEKHVYDGQYLVRYDDWLKNNNNKADTQENYEMFRKECESEGKTVEKNGIHCGIVNTKTAILNENESKTESIVFNEYVVYDESQYLPMSAVTVERSEYLIIWRDSNFIKGGCGYEENENYSEKFHNNLNVNKKFISAHSDCNVYCEPTTEGALELIRRKKCNKIILISNIGDDLSGQFFVEEARKILGSNVIVFFNDSNVKHLNWIKFYPNALFSNEPKFFEEFISNFNETGLISLKNEIEKHYKVQLNEFDDDFLRYPYFINEGKYHSIKDIDNHEVLKQKTIQQIPKSVNNLDNGLKQFEKQEKEMKRKVDNYSIIIVCKYLQTENDFINIICVCKNYKKTLKKFRYNPISIFNTMLFPKIKTQYLYSPNEKRIKEIELYKICYPVSYHEYLDCKNDNISCLKVFYDSIDSQHFNGTFPSVVHSLGKGCFENNRELTSVTIPSFITSLSQKCFSNCLQLKNVKLSDCLNEIPSLCFGECTSLTSIELLSSITAIHSSAFYGCDSIKKLQIPDSVKYIDQNAFCSCKNLEEIHLPTSINVISFGLFSYCISLKRIHIPKKVSLIENNSFEGCCSLSKLILPSSIKRIGWEAFKNCRSLKTLKIPNTCGYVGFNAIKRCEYLDTIEYPTNKFGYWFNISYNEYLFLKRFKNNFMRIEWDDQLTKNDEVDIPEICNWLSEGCYSTSSIKSSMIPHSVKNIQSECFKDCQDLTSIYIPTSVTFIGESVFEGCTFLKEIVLTSNLNEISSKLFKNCHKLKSIEIPSTITEIGNECFAKCSSLTSLYIPSNCVVGKGCFEGCKSLQKCNIPNINKKINYEITTEDFKILSKFGYKCNKCVYKSSTKEEQIPNLKYKYGLDHESYKESEREEIIFPQTVTSLGKCCFSECTNLSSLVILSTIVSIGDNCFEGCSSLLEIEIPSTITYFGNFIFEECTSLTKIIIPNNEYKGVIGMKEAFIFKSLGIKCLNIAIKQEDWEEYKMIVPQVNCLSCFDDYQKIKEINIPTTVNAILAKSFFYCELLTSITIPSSVTKIERNSFNCCFSLKNIKFNASITRLENETFQRCGIEYIELPTTLNEIGIYAFGCCLNLKKVIIPSTISKIENYSFNTCTSLSELEIDPKCQIIEWPCVSFHCISLKRIILPTSVTRIADNSFDECSSLTEVMLPNVKYMGNNVFKNCFSLPSINLPTTLTRIGSFCFEKCLTLKEIQLPNSVIETGDQLFLECTSLSSITLSESLTKVDKLIFNKCDNIKQIYIGDNKVKKYPFEVNFDRMMKFKEIGISCEEVVFTREDIILRSIIDCEIPKEVKYLEDNCFRNNDRYKLIILHKGIKKIGKDCFLNTIKGCVKK